MDPNNVPVEEVGANVEVGNDPIPPAAGPVPDPVHRPSGGNGVPDPAHPPQGSLPYRPVVPQPLGMAMELDNAIYQAQLELQNQQYQQQHQAQQLIQARDELFLRQQEVLQQAAQIHQYQQQQQRQFLPMGAGGAPDALQGAQAADHPLDSHRIPVFFGSDKDTFTPQLWIERVERTARLHGWSDQLTVASATNALRDLAAKWYDGCQLHFSLHTWHAFKTQFLRMMTPSAITELEPWTFVKEAIAPRTRDESLLEYFSRVSSLIRRLKLAITDDMPPDQFPLLAMRSVRQLPGAEALPLTDWQAPWLRQREMTQTAMANILAKGAFLSGLSPELQALVRARAPDQRKTMADVFKICQEAEIQNPGISNISAVSKRQKTGPSREKPKHRLLANGQPMICHYCSKKGHGEKECRKRLREGGQLQSAGQRPAAANAQPAHAVTQRDPPGAPISDAERFSAALSKNSY